jgi:hypothetical protein
MVLAKGTAFPSHSLEVTSPGKVGSSAGTNILPARQLRFAVGQIVAVFFLLLTSCATLQVPVAEPSLSQQQLLSATQNGISLGARPILEEDEYLKLFDDFLPEIGIVVLWVEVRNARSEVIHLQPANWSLQTGSHQYHALNIRDLFERYYGGRGIRMYALSTDRRARQRMEAVAFPFGSLGPGVTRNGFLFFAIDPALSSVWDRDAILGIREIHLDRGSKFSLEIKISHANP